MRSSLSEPGTHSRPPCLPGRPGQPPVLMLLILGWIAGGASAIGADIDYRLDDAKRQAIVVAIAELIETRYVEPATGRQAIDRIESRLGEGDYASLELPQDLAGALTEDLSAFDRHFHVFWRPPGSGPAPGSHGDDADAHWRELSRLQNYGFERLARLPGNIGYLDLRYFDGVETGGSTAVAAMAFLANSDAVIVDLRHNGGGEPAMVQILASYFFGSERVHYNSFYSRTSDSLEQYWTLARVEGRRMPEVPLYILTARRTGSAAEGFSYALQALGRATIVGETTAGAAHPGETFEAIDGFSLFVSTGKPINPITGSNWEKTGVRPDVEVPSVDALDRARILALEKLLETKAGELAQRERAWALEALEALRDPPELGADSRAEYVGAYGNRTIAATDGGLSYQRADRRLYPMIYLDGDRFLLDGKDGFRLQFERDGDGTIVRLIDQWSDGHVEANPRD